MAAKYGEDLNGWASNYPEGPRGCGVWKIISMGKEHFFRFVRFKINNGERVCFWLDPWYDRRPLALLFPSCFNLAVSKGVSERSYDQI